MNVLGHFDMTVDDYPGNIEDVNEESDKDNSELKDKKSAVRAARHYLNTVVNQMNILAEKNQLNKDGSTNSNEDT